MRHHVCLRMVVTFGCYISSVYSDSRRQLHVVVCHAYVWRLRQYGGVTVGVVRYSYIIACAAVCARASASGYVDVTGCCMQLDMRLYGGYGDNTHGWMASLRHASMDWICLLRVDNTDMFVSRYARAMDNAARARRRRYARVCAQICARARACVSACAKLARRTAMTVRIDDRDTHAGALFVGPVFVDRLDRCRLVQICARARSLSFRVCDLLRRRSHAVRACAGMHVDLMIEFAVRARCIPTLLYGVSLECVCLRMCCMSVCTV